MNARTEWDAWRHAAEALKRGDPATAGGWIVLAKTAFGQDLADSGWIWTGS